MTLVKALQGLAALMATALVATVLASYGNVGPLLPIPVGIFAGAMGYIFLIYGSEAEDENWPEDPFAILGYDERSA
jgi:hypothetical protein